MDGPRGGNQGVRPAGQAAERAPGGAASERRVGAHRERPTARSWGGGGGGGARGTARQATTPPQTKNPPRQPQGAREALNRHGARGGGAGERNGPGPHHSRPGALPQTPSGGTPWLRFSTNVRERNGPGRTFGPTWGSLAASQYQGRCLLGVRALPGSHLSGGLQPRVPRRRRWTWLPVAACTCGATPHGPARRTQPRRAPGPTSCGGLGRTYSPPTRVCQHPLDLRGFAKSAGQCGAPRHAATGRGRTVRPHAAIAPHPFGGAKTVRPPTTVRSATGRSRPGVRSGRPGVPERGSVDQLATRSSGAWTTRSATFQTA
jgi:hypothetical protein